MIKLLLFFSILWAQSDAPVDTHIIEGRAQFWSAAVADEKPAIPQQVGEAQKLATKLTRPVQPGTFTGEYLQVETDMYQAAVEFRWMLPANGDPDYIATQVVLRLKTGELIALCSTYSLPNKMESMPTGACSGRHESRLIGITLTR